MSFKWAGIHSPPLMLITLKWMPVLEKKGNIRKTDTNDNWKDSLHSNQTLSGFLRVELEGKILNFLVKNSENPIYQAPIRVTNSQFYYQFSPLFYVISY